MNEQSYRTLPRIANSDLSELERIVLGKPPLPVSRAALDFGTAFHTLILEPCKFQHPATVDDDTRTLYGMERAVLDDVTLTALLNVSTCEVVRTWTDPETGLPLKCKIDAIPSPRHLIDLKTTSALTTGGFALIINLYHYDRQAAFYLSSDPDAEYFELVGVGKKPPYPLFRFPLHRSGEVIDYGRKKMRRLLRRAAEELTKTDGWRPSSWSREEGGEPV